MGRVDFLHHLLKLVAFGVVVQSVMGEVPV